jgi:RNA polymerase sigma-70 factor (ECF subfamily)
MRPTADHEATFRTWIEAHRGIFVKVARSFACGETAATDLQQEMMFQLWLSLPRYAGQSKPSTWIYRVCLNTAMSWRRG